VIPPPAALALARQHGITVTLDGDRLKYHAPGKPPAEVLAALAADKAAIIAHLRASAAADAPAVTGPLPPALAQVELWRASFARLSPHVEPCPGFRGDGEWPRVHAAIAAFLDADADPWARIAAEANWSTAELFAVHRQVGAANLAACGALLCTNGARVTRIAEQTIWFANGLIARRVPIDPATSVPVWDFERGARDA
jgi:hypothetical protein